MAKKVIQWAGREKRLAVNKGVGRSFLKTITEPVTNADSILKKKAGVEHSAGLVDLLLGLKKGDRVDSAHLKTLVPKAKKRAIRVEIATSGKHARRCRIVDAGLGMTLAEIESKFGDYASAKAKGEKTRSLFGRGALDVLLHHEDSVLYSVKNGVLSRCKFFFEDDTMFDPEELGKVTPAILRRHGLPATIADGGTVVEFTIAKDTSIPAEDSIIDRLSSFYMLRLIAADPNTEIVIERTRSDGKHEDPLNYDFPVGTVLGRFRDTLALEGYGGPLPIDIMVARSDVPLTLDPDNIERRVSGMLFVDESDAVLDLTLTPEFERSPHLSHLYGVVRITGIREVLESHLESRFAEAILTATRDGFDRKNAFAVALFQHVAKHVRPIFEQEERNQRKGESDRSEAVTRNLNEALKALNLFNADETEDVGEDEGPEGPSSPPAPRAEAIYFDVDATRLHAGVAKRVFLNVNLEKIPNGEIVLFESTNPNLVLAPDSATIEAKNRTDRIRSPLHISCDIKGESGTIVAITLDRDGKTQRASIEVRGVDDAPVPRVPETMEFAAAAFAGKPNRENKATLLVNLDAFPGKPEITFWLEKSVGVTLMDDRVLIKVTDSDIIKGSRVARVTLPFKGTAWGQTASLMAKAKRAGGEVRTKCKLKFVQDEGNDKFSKVEYYDLKRPVLGDVAENILYINSGYPLHVDIFGSTEAEFNQALEVDRTAQMRTASILVETVIYHAAVTKWRAGGKKGLDLNPNDPVGSVRVYLDERRMKLEARVFRALVKDPPQRADGALSTERAG